MECCYLRNMSRYYIVVLKYHDAKTWLATSRVLRISKMGKKVLLRKSC